MARMSGLLDVAGGWLAMAVTVEMHNTGDPELQREVVATVEQSLANRPGDRRVWIVGSQARQSRHNHPRRSFSNRVILGEPWPVIFKETLHFLAESRTKILEQGVGAG